MWKMEEMERSKRSEQDTYSLLANDPNNELWTKQFH